jgi:hypothetical protein
MILSGWETRPHPDGPVRAFTARSTNTTPLVRQRPVVGEEQLELDPLLPAQIEPDRGASHRR